MINQTRTDKNVNDITFTEIENLIAQLEEGETKDIVMMKIKLFVKSSDYEGDNANKLREIFINLDKEFAQLGNNNQINYYNDRLYQELKTFLGIEDLVENIAEEKENKNDYINKNIDEYFIDNNYYQDDEGLKI